MAGIEQGGNFQKDKSQLAKEAKEKLRESLTNTEKYMQTLFVAEGLQKIREQAMANTDRLNTAVNDIPELKEYLESAGRVTVTREYLPRLNRVRTGIYLTSEGLVLGPVGKRGSIARLTGNVIAGESGLNGAIDKLGSLSTREVIERVAERIAPDTKRK